MITNINKYLNIALIVIILILLLLLGKDWLRPKLIESLGGYTHKQEAVETSVEFKKGTIDTLEIFNNYVKTKGIIIQSKSSTKTINKTTGKTVKSPYTEIEGDNILKLKEFVVNVDDSLINGTVNIQNTQQGELFNATLNYKPKFPKYITSTDTITKTIVRTETLSNKRSKIGVGIGYNNLQYASILGSYTFKNGVQVIGEYGKNINAIQQADLNTINEQFLLKDNFVSIKLIKNF